jgi:hypothetical protein
MRTKEGVGGSIFGLGSRTRGGPAEMGEGQISIAGTEVVKNFLGSG